jgi:hypothetical protein
MLKMTAASLVIAKDHEVRQSLRTGSCHPVAFGDYALDVRRILEIANKAYCLYFSQDSAYAQGMPYVRRPLRGPKQKNGRGDWIRTNDPLLPKQVRYQTALRPEP